jgi:hypothetical protein
MNQFNPFHSGKITSVLDVGAGSSSKALVSSWLVKNHRPQILMTANGRNSSHTVVDSQARPNAPKAIFKVLPAGCFYNGVDMYYPLIYIGPGAAFTIRDLEDEMKAHGLSSEQVRIHPCASIVQQSDIDYENGLASFDGAYFRDVDHSSGTTAHGTTGSGAGCARAHKSLRKGVIARDVVPEMCCDPIEIVRMLNKGARALLDGSQGYQLSLYSANYPFCTSRSTTLASFFAELDMPPSLIGDVVGVARTHPIRIASKRYWSPGTKSFLTHDQVQEYKRDNMVVEEIDSNSGGWMSDQTELTWEQLSERAGHHIEPEYTSLTKLRRRLASFSHLGLAQYLAMNQPPAPHRHHLAITFMNYLRLDAKVRGEFLSGVRMTSDDAVDRIMISDSSETDSLIGADEGRSVVPEAPRTIPCEVCKAITLYRPGEKYQVCGADCLAHLQANLAATYGGHG